MRLYSGLWRFASLPDLMALAKAVSLVVLVFFPLLFLVNRLEAIPRSVPVIQWMLMLGLLGGPRFLYRFWCERSLGVTYSLSEKIPLLLIGATQRAELFLRDVDRQPGALFQVVAIVDDRQGMIGRTLHRIKILGGYDQLPGIIAKLAENNLKPQKVVIADDDLDGETVQTILRTTEQQGIPLARLPRLTELKPGTQDVMQIRPIAVEDLLGRAQAVRDKSAFEQFLSGKNILITGAGGTIGGELSRQIAEFAPKQLVLLESSEFALYQIEREVLARKPDFPVIPVLCDIRDAASVAKLFAQMKPEIVFHAAAVKHVPLSESNPEEAIHTNVFGTKIIAEACIAQHVMAMVLISTDKAVHPSNIMGASKRLAERLCQGMAQKDKISTRFVTVRFGNVLGSTGSVVPLFQEQLAKGGPLTVTHADMERYFMTVREAVELVILASATGSQMKERNTIFVLDMGKRIKIADLARQMIRLAGLRPDKDIHIEYTGLREGEKLYEELFYDHENLIKTSHERLMLATPPAIDFSVLLPKLEMFRQTLLERDPNKTRKHLHHLVPEYTGAVDAVDATNTQRKLG
jgi:FlaA1/EpsC-like NDP-sugar epimerase